MQLEETEKIFDEFWEHHACQLKQSLELRTFEQDFEETKVNKNLQMCTNKLMQNLIFP